jgi:hypothetical protein
MTDLKHTDCMVKRCKYQFISLGRGRGGYDENFK